MMPTMSYRPDTPTFVFDGDCGFCLTWVDYFQHVVGDRVRFVAADNIADEIADIDIQEFRQAVHFIEPDGRVTRAAQATFRMLAHAPSKGVRFWQWCYQTIPGFAPTAERVYRTVANHRDGALVLTRWLIGVPVRSLTYTLLVPVILVLVLIVWGIVILV